MGFTENQIKAINSSGRDVLVSAAAGSGKTTVLVERIIRRVLNEDDPVDIDRMLVLTFTKAAAAQMRDKILKAIEKKAEEDPDNAHLAKQSLLIHNAQISTFHGFCQEIIRNHFYEIDADPQLRVADEGEVKLMQMDALEKVLESAYEEADEEFLKAVESYSSGKNDKNLEKIILKIYHLAQAQPDPDKYLDACEDAYDVTDTASLEQKKWFAQYLELLRDDAKNAVSIAQKMIIMCDELNGPVKYRPMIQDDLNFARSIENAENFEGMRLMCRTHSKMKLASITAKDTVDDDIKERVKALRERFYKITDAITNTVKTSLEQEVVSMQSVAVLNRVFIRLTRDFARKYAELKNDNGVIDFNDMEHLAIRILRNNEGVTAGLYREKFVEIYVDEYQDSNLTQEELVSLISRDNVFMVGDVKQSIYRFRMARPDLFLGKYKSFTPYDVIHGNKEDIANDNQEDSIDDSCIVGERIDLSDNFRSRQEVLNCVNEIFFNIMNENLGGIEYDDAASLHYGHLYDNKNTELEKESEKEPEVDGETADEGDKARVWPEYSAELILAGSDEDMTAAESEASCIATRIRQLVGNLDIVDEDTKELRKLKYSDIVILLRSMTGRDNVYRDVLMSCGIPAYVTTGGGYFASREIETLLNFLSVIDNPLQDVPLAAVLKSVLFDFTDEELALLKLEGTAAGIEDVKEVSKEIPEKESEKSSEKERNIYLYEAVLKSSMDKTVKFVNILDHFRRESDYMSVYEILREIIDGEYGEIVRSGRNGHQAEANLNMLLKKAEDFGKLSYKGLFHFLRYIDQIRKYEIDYGEAGITDESDNNVRIMTIHKSKGLEFPVVFVSALSKSRNTNDEKAEIIPDSELGIGLSYADLEKRIKKSTLMKDCMISRLKKENLAEEIRVLYVALTRAKEKVIMVAASDDENKDFYEKQKPLTMCDSYLDLLAYAYNNQENGFKNTHVIKMSSEDYIFMEMARQLSDESREERLKTLLKSGNSVSIVEKDDKIAHAIQKRFLWKYSHAGEALECAKVSVSELKKASMEEALSRENSDLDVNENKKDLFASHGEKDAYVPDFIREEGEAPSAGTFYGTAFHRMAELWDYAGFSGDEDNVTEKTVSDYFEKKCELGLISRVQLDAVKAGELVAFIKSDAARRMGIADKKGLLFREQPFTLGLDPGPMLVQGIIDVYWIENGEIVILDYKTDRVSESIQLVERYHVQLEYYDMALKQLLELPVKERLIYSTRLNEIVGM